MSRFEAAVGLSVALAFSSAVPAHGQEALDSTSGITENVCVVPDIEGADPRIEGPNMVQINEGARIINALDRQRRDVAAAGDNRRRREAVEAQFARAFRNCTLADVRAAAIVFATLHFDASKSEDIEAQQYLLEGLERLRASIERGRNII